jgi:signal transduction histidine kinase
MTPMAVDVRFIGGASQQWTRIAATPRRLANGVVRWDGIGLDITEQRADLTRRLLDFASRPALKPETFDVNRLVTDITPLLEGALGIGIEVAFEPAASACAVHVDRAQLERAILDLATNARDAMQRGGRVTIATALVSLDAAEATRVGDIAAGAYVRLSLADQGSGMSPDIVARVTEPFFTTKPGDQGTGLGLSMVYGFVHQSGGAMAIDSTPGKGTTVHLYLPRVAVGATGDNEALLVAEAAR